MKVETLQITWHSREGSKNEPLLSVDMHPTLPILATAGADWEVKLWRIHESPAESETKVNIEYICTLTGHQKTVNVLRFSPNGECLATAGDDSACIIWNPLPDFRWDTIRSERNFQRRALRRHTEDIYDLSWAPDSRHLVTASIDNTSIVWDVSRGRDIGKLDGHSQYVQGVAWDPAGQFIATQSNDRSVRIYRIFQRRQGSRRREMVPVGRHLKGTLSFQCIQVLRSRLVVPSADASTDTPSNSSAGAANATIPQQQEQGAIVGNTAAQGEQEAGTTGPETSSTEGIRRHMYLDGNVPSFFRRLAWSPDGSFLITPCGAYQKHATDTVRPTTYLFERSTLGTPSTTYLAHLPGAYSSKPSIVVRPSPVFYSLRSIRPAGSDEDVVPNNGVFELPYRMLVAVATLDSVYIYDTQIAYPIAALSNFHCDKITDICWSSSGMSLFICSIDGYCSVVSFQSTELGEPLNLEQYPETLRLPHSSTYSTRVRKQKDSSASGDEANASETDTAKRPSVATTKVDGVSTPEQNSQSGGQGSKKRRVALIHVAPLGADIQDVAKQSVDTKSQNTTPAAVQASVQNTPAQASVQATPSTTAVVTPKATSSDDSKPVAGAVTGGALDSLLRHFAA